MNKRKSAVSFIINFFKIIQFKYIIVSLANIINKVLIESRRTTESIDAIRRNAFARQ